jgi:hypothetical protein
MDASRDIAQRCRHVEGVSAKQTRVEQSGVYLFQTTVTDDFAVKHDPSVFGDVRARWPKYSEEKSSKGCILYVSTIGTFPFFMKVESYPRGFEDSIPRSGF